MVGTTEHPARERSTAAPAGPRLVPSLTGLDKACPMHRQPRALRVLAAWGRPQPSAPLGEGRWVTPEGLQSERAPRQLWRH